MKIEFFIITILLVAQISHAQQPPSGGLVGTVPAASITASVNGKVINKAGQALEAATVSLHKLPDSALVTGNRTGVDGSYLFTGLKLDGFT